LRAAGVLLYRVRPDGRREYLLLRNAKHRSWGFAKGHVEPGETERQAALREVFEETGLRPDRLRRGFAHRSRYRFRHRECVVDKRVVHFLAEAPQARMRISREHDLAKWELPGRATWYLRRFRNLTDALRRAERSLARVRPSRP